MMRIATVAGITASVVLAGCGFFTPEDNSLGPHNTIVKNAEDSTSAVQFLKSIKNWGGNFSEQIDISNDGRVSVIYIDGWKGGDIAFPKTGMDSLKGIYISKGCAAKSIRFTGLERFTSLTSAVFNCPDLATWPEGLLDNKRWRSFTFYSGSITAIPDDILKADSLKKLYIPSQNISSLPEGLWRLPNLGTKFWMDVVFEENKLCSVSDSTRLWLNRVNKTWEPSQRCP